jgi:FHS family L-fucose permease-like MFS transporter
LLVISMFTTGSVAIWTLVLCGFFNSIMFPNVFALGIAGLGSMTSKGSGLIMTAVVGGAIIPYLLGTAADKLAVMWALAHDRAAVDAALAQNVLYHSTIADRIGIQHALVIPLFCYLYIAWYGLWGSHPSRTAA